MEISSMVWMGFIIAAFISSCGPSIPVSHSNNVLLLNRHPKPFAGLALAMSSRGHYSAGKTESFPQLLLQKSSHANTSYRTFLFGKNGISIEQVRFQLFPFFLTTNGILKSGLIAQSETADLTWLWIILLALGGIGFIVAGLGVSGKLPKRKTDVTFPSNSPSEEQPSKSADNKYCPHCGAANPLQAGFCTKCGVQFPSR